jgi:uncharacterized protein (TIGR00369 family)
MSALLDRIQAARAAGDPRLITAEIPYAKWLGLDVELSPEGELRGLLRFTNPIIGNATIPAIHGGPLGALLEWTAIFELLWRAETIHLPKTITITVDYLRPGRPLDTRARAIVTRQSRRVANVRMEAYQQQALDRPIAAANALFLLVPPKSEG